MIRSFKNSSVQKFLITFGTLVFAGLRPILLKTSEGYILIDTVHQPFVGHLIDNLAVLGVDPSEIKYVLMTHGHFDHVGGATTLKPFYSKMRRLQWEKRDGERHLTSRARKRGGKTMIQKEKVLKTKKKVTFRRYFCCSSGYSRTDIPWALFFYLYPVYVDGKKYTAVTIGGFRVEMLRYYRQKSASGLYQLFI